MGASAFLKSVDFTAFEINVKTISPTQKLYQSGHAIWLSSMPVPVLSFLEEYDFSGKTIIPIATSQALGLGSGPEQIAAACPDAVVEDGLSARSEDGVKHFLEKAGLAQ